ncbi:beta-ketoacyl synthase N-terminal-like domain-containing protein [Amycolatopsis japonica]|uniref:beta-ketoacyl synthase N-terminal-like domain-containing protein n=1 Tax=Amycolatopsis japonica TaxID=208439 RepID=UPI00366BDDA7
MFEPIAIVGRGCVLPGALSPQEFWRNIADRRISTSTVPSGRWRLPDDAVARLTGPAPCPVRTSVGGYVTGFDAVFDPGGFRLPAEDLAGLDPLFQWVMHGAREALREADAEEAVERTGLILGNLSLPTDGMVRFAEQVWLSAQPERVRDALRREDPVLTGPAAVNRFSSAMPAHLAATALGLGAGAYALDAACASALFSIKLACERLHNRSADLMVAGAVNRVDNLTGHVSFGALGALSPTGRSRPFHRGADGLVPAEGAAFVALTRLSDALAEGKQVFGVIRGVGLSNDGSGTGLLVPSQEGQLRAMMQAYAEAEIDPATVSLLECHATGTSLGDATEARSAAEVFAEARDLPIGSAKSNLGHLVTAAGGAGVLKVLGAFEAMTRPPTLSAEEPIDVLRDTPLRLLHDAEPWDGPRRAAISAFGFGGNNAHLLLDPGPPDSAAALAPLPAPIPADAPDVAIVAIGVRAGGCANYEEFREHLLSGGGRTTRVDALDVVVDGLRTPPIDLKKTLGQQSLVLEATREAVAGLDLPRERTMVLVGMGCDAEVARQPSRVRATEWVRTLGAQDGTQAVQDSFGDVLDVAQVVGTMPNVVANRISFQLDLAGPGFTVSAEQASGVVALDLAVRALRAGTADAVVVGAVDLSAEPVHEQAARELGITEEPGDAAVVLVLKRADDARRDSEPTLALVGVEPAPDAELFVGDSDAPARFDPTELFGAPHAAKGLLAVACAAVALRHGAIPRYGKSALPLLHARPSALVEVRTLGADASRVALRAAEDPVPWAAEAPLRLHVYSGSDVHEALAAARAGRESGEGPARLVVLADDEQQLTARVAAAARWLTGKAVRPVGVAFQARPIAGEVAFVHSNGSACYPEMGRELLLAFPGELRRLERGKVPVGEVMSWVYSGGTPSHALDQTNAAGLLSQVQTGVVRTLLGLEPNAVIGYSSGEMSALTCLNAWEDAAGMLSDVAASPLFVDEIAGKLELVRRTWRQHGVTDGTWAAFQINVDAARVRAATANEPTVHLVAVNAPGLCVLGGESEACRRVLGELGNPTALPLDYAITVHIPEVEQVRDEWRRLYDRPTTPLPGTRFYSCATAEPYVVTREAVADAVTAQAVKAIDFVATVERAWQDGVRVFVEFGPQGLCTAWTKMILGDREHLAITLDSAGGQGIRSLYRGVIELVAAGIEVDHERLAAHLAAATAASRPSGRTLTLPAHQDPVDLPDLLEVATPMPPAPPLPLVTAPVRVRVSVPAPRMSPAVPSMRPAALASPFGPMAQTHTEFLRQQGRGHESYLAVMAHAQRLLLQGPRQRPTPPARPAPLFDRAQLETHAGGLISDVFGPRFRAQDGYHRQVRMPQPPLLLVDRVTSIDAEPCRIGVGSIRTETDVTEQCWYLDPSGRMPAGFAVEAGQADLMLISWMGADLHNRGERVYRLLGCDITFYGSPPVPGETLAFDITIDQHHEHNGVHVFLFHFDCRVGDELRLTVRNAQAGFFRDEELASTSGILWDPAADPPDLDAPHQAPALVCQRREFGPDLVALFAQGRLDECFGAEWAETRNHLRTPRITDGALRFLHEVVDFAPHGGPWGRGYLRARSRVAPDDWFFAAHFKDDPCMPGMLMFEGCLQAMAFHLSALGHTVNADGWRFEPVTGAAMQMRCRGQVTPESREIEYELFVAEVTTDPVPTIIADVLITVDGKKAFHGRRVGLRLVPPAAALPVGRGMFDSAVRS